MRKVAVALRKTGRREGSMGSKGWLLETKLENRTDTLNIWLRVFGAGLDEGLVVEERVDACRGAKWPVI